MPSQSLEQQPARPPSRSGTTIPPKLEELRDNNSKEIWMEKIHPTVSEIHILADGYAHMCQMGNDGQAQLCQMGKRLDAAQLEVVTIP